MPELSTGLVIAGAYADKLRRTLFAQLRDKVKSGEISGREVARAAAEVNRLLFDIIVNRLKLDKGDVVRIRVSYEVRDSSIHWFLDTLRVEAFRRIPDDEVEEAVKEVVASAEAGKEETTTEEAGEEAPERAGEPGVNIKEVIPLGRTMEGGLAFIARNEKDENIGLIIAEDRAGTIVLDAILIPEEGRAFKAYVKSGHSLEELSEKPSIIIAELSKARLVEIEPSAARSIIEERMKSIA